MPKKNKAPTPRVRRLITGERVPDADSLMHIPISTRSPRKWLFIDLETGDVWRPRVTKDTYMGFTFERPDFYVLVYKRKS